MPLGQATHGVVDAAPAFDYTITSPPSGQRVKPGDVIEFDVTVHNRSNSDRSLTLTGMRPFFTDNGGFVPGKRSASTSAPS